MELAARKLSYICRLFAKELILQNFVGLPYLTVSKLTRGR